MKKYIFLLLCIYLSTYIPAQKLPQIIKSEKGDFQILVHGKPFLMLGGELSNSATSDVGEMTPIWSRLKNRNLNTVLAPVYWELLEPAEGQFDFTLVDSMIIQARRVELKLVFLWFGTWKNSMSCYTPSWVKLDDKRFPRTRDEKGIPSEIISAFNENILKADIKAYTALLSHIKSIDAASQTVIMIQVENEIGQLPSARDYSKEAEKFFQKDVPAEFIKYMNSHKLLPYLSDLWKDKVQKGNWETVFGKSLATDELFTAWYYARFADKVAEAGKKVYNLPVYVNCALNRPGVDPGKYPSGGPLPHLIDVWKAGASSIDMLSPDVYHGDFRNWLALYELPNNAVFLPEIKMEPENAVQVFYTVGKRKSLGYCPFAIEMAHENEYEPLSKSYGILEDLTEMILYDRKKVEGVYLDKSQPADTLQFGEYRLVVSHVSTLPWSDGSRLEKWAPGGCVVIEKAPGEFWIGGTGVTVSFKNTVKSKMTTGILSADIARKTPEGWHFIRLNGDQTHQGRHMRIGSNQWEIQKIKLYDYQ